MPGTRSAAIAASSALLLVQERQSGESEVFFAFFPDMLAGFSFNSRVWLEVLFYGFTHSGCE